MRRSCWEQIHHLDLLSHTCITIKLIFSLEDCSNAALDRSQTASSSLSANVESAQSNRHNHMGGVFRKLPPKLMTRHPNSFTGSDWTDLT